MILKSSLDRKLNGKYVYQRKMYEENDVFKPICNCSWKNSFMIEEINLHIGCSVLYKTINKAQIKYKLWFCFNFSLSHSNSKTVGTYELLTVILLNKNKLSWGSMKKSLFWNVEKNIRRWLQGSSQRLLK